MIPPRTGDTRSPGERELYAWLRDHPETGDWVVLHSLELAEHVKQVKGEADFVILVPGHGVLCLEVKACRTLHRADGLWHFGHEPGVPRSPFKQAEEAMQSLRKRVLGADPDLASVLFCSAAAFPYVEFHDKSVEWHDWQAIDARSWREESIGPLLVGVLQQAKAHIESTSPKRFGACLSSEQCGRIANILRGDFDCYVSPKHRRRLLDLELKRYTEEQFRSLDLIADNARVVVSGSAGTGKTLLAVESACRAADACKKVLLACYNRPLADDLRQRVADWPAIACNNLARHMLAVSGLQAPTNATAEFWNRELPERACEAVMSGGEHHLFDEIILDEAQDIFRPEMRGYIDFLDVSLHDGLARGRWILFGDWENQALYQNTRAFEEILDELKSSFTRATLRRNCRNTPRVARLAARAGCLPSEPEVLRPDDQVEPEFRFGPLDDHPRLLADVLQSLFDAKYEAKEIVVLSPRARDCAASKVAQHPWSQRLKPLDEIARNQGYVGYTTIRRFKGLENTVVIVTDVGMVEPEDRDLLYVALTRALGRVYVLIDSQQGIEMVKALLA